MAKPDPERAWQQALDAHAHALLGAVAREASDYRADVRGGDDLGGRPTVEICGPDGEWRRYYVRLTAANPGPPISPEHLQAMRS